MRCYERAREEYLSIQVDQIPFSKRGVTLRAALACGALLFGMLFLAACQNPNSSVSVQESVEMDSAAEAVSEPGQSKPNILLIVADDLGFTDLGYMGGEISTPNIDALAERGIVFTNFYGAPVCTPTRAQLLTGADNNLVGSGEGESFDLSATASTIPEVIGPAGYETIMVGKWDLGWAQGKTPADRGFDHSFVILPGAIDHYSATHKATKFKDIGPLIEGSAPVLAGDNFHTTISFTDKLIEYLDNRDDTNVPFFVYGSYMAPHWPLQAPVEMIDKYEARYLEGYNAIRDARIARLRQSELAELVDTPHPADGFLKWDELSEEDKRLEARRMAAYAAMLEVFDTEIGRLLQHLDEIGETEDTIILFVSDNGADPHTDNNVPFLLPDIAREEADNSYENIGQPGSYVAYGPDWARVSSGPLNGVKGMSTEGGIAVPAIMVLPDQAGAGSLNRSVLGMRDLTATIYDLAGVQTESIEELSPPLEGLSFASAGSDPNAQQFATRAVGTFNKERYTKEEVSALHKGAWKLVRSGEDASWALFNLEADRGETNDLILVETEIANELWLEWLAYAERVGIDAGSSPTNRGGK